MPDSPTVSVLMRTYNRAHLVGKAIRSVLNQTFTDWELLVVDDGSQDNTQEVVLAFQDRRIRYLRHQRNRGPTATTNTGIQAARGQYLAFQDDDVEALPRRLESQLEVFRRPGNEDVAVVICAVAHLLRGNKVSVRTATVNGWVYEQLLSHRGSVGEFSGYLANLHLLGDSALADESLPGHDDYDFLVCNSKRGRVLSLREVMAFCLEHDGDRASSPTRMLAGYLRLHERYSEEFHARPSAHSQHHVLTARGYWRVGDMDGCRRELLKAMNTRYSNLEPYGYLVASQLGRSGYGCYRRLHEVFSRLVRPWSIPRSLLARMGWRRPLPIPKELLREPDLGT